MLVPLCVVRWLSLDLTVVALSLVHELGLPVRSGMCQLVTSEPSGTLLTRRPTPR